MVIVRYSGLLAWLLLCSAPADAVIPAGPVDVYREELARQCPAKQLYRLDPHDLQVALGRFSVRLPRQSRNKNSSITDNLCAVGPYPHNPECENSAALNLLIQENRLREATSFVCMAFEGCSDQSDCR